MNPGLMIKVAALEIEAARESPTNTGEKWMLPTAKSAIVCVRSAPRTTKNKIRAA